MRQADSDSATLALKDLEHLGDDKLAALAALW
jgi:hypothetical protein